MSLFEKQLLDKYNLFLSIHNPLLTVFITTHKRPQYLTILIKSLMNQTFVNFCAIVLDNMSKDETETIVNDFHDERLMYLEHPRPNFTYAFSIVRTKYIVVLHDDDELKNNYLEEMIFAMENNGSIVLLSPVADLINSEGAIIEKAKESGTLEILSDDNYLIDYYLKMSGKSLIYPAILYRSSFFCDMESFVNIKAGPATDQLLYFETCRRGGVIGVLNLALFNYRMHSSQESALRGSDMDFKLINYLYSIDYYRPILYKYRTKIAGYIKKSLHINLRNYVKSKDKKSLREDYSIIPEVCKKSLRGRIFTLLFFIAKSFPTTSSLVFKVLKRAR